MEKDGKWRTKCVCQLDLEKGSKSERGRRVIEVPREGAGECAGEGAGEDKVLAG